MRDWPYDTSTLQYLLYVGSVVRTGVKRGANRPPLSGVSWATCSASSNDKDRAPTVTEQAVAGEVYPQALGSVCGNHDPRTSASMVEFGDRSQPKFQPLENGTINYSTVQNVPCKFCGTVCPCCIIAVAVRKRIESFIKHSPCSSTTCTAVQKYQY